MHEFDNTDFKGQDIKMASKAVVFVHGRGDTTDKMKTLAKQVVSDSDVALIFPKATHNTWYPKGFLAPWEENQPYLNSALDNLHHVIEHLNSAGIKNENIFLLGFSQGACLTIEYAARNASKYAGIMVLSGGLIGPYIEPKNYQGSFSNTEVLIGCSDIDHHIPVDRLHETEQVLLNMGAKVDKRIYPGMDHIINEDEIIKIKEMVNGKSN